MNPSPDATPIVLAVVALLATAQGCGRSEQAPSPPEPRARPAATEPAELADAQETEAPDRAVGGFSFEAYAYDCQGLAVTVRPGDQGMTVILPDQTLVLPQVEAASGARYVEGNAGFWGKGINSATLTLDGEEIACQLDRRETLWVDARARGATFRGVGQEPGWFLEIHPDRLVFVYQYGGRRVVAPNPGAVADADQALHQWHATTEAHQLSVRVEDRSCTDVMSGDIYPATVAVKLDGRDYTGCGRNLE